MSASPRLPHGPQAAATHAATLRHMAAPSRLRESLRLQRPASVRNAWLAGVQAALACVLVCALLRASPWAAMTGYGGLGALAALYGRFAPARQRHAQVLLGGLLLVLPVAVLSLFTRAGPHPVALLLALAGMAGVRESLAHRTQIGAPGAVIFIFAASAALVPAGSALEVLQRTLATALGVAAAWAVCHLTDRLRQAAVAPVAPTAAPVPTAPVTQARALPADFAMGQSLRVVLCAAVAALLAHAAGWSHPAWAAIGATAVLQGAHLPGTAHRAWQRSLGTLGGAVIAWALLSADLSFWSVLAAVAVLQVVTETVIGFNYAIGQLFVTPMALLMTRLAGHGEALDMALSRVLDTTLGAVVGIVLTVALSSLDERLHLARHASGPAHS